MSRENNDSLNKGDVHNCQLLVKIEIETRVCAQMVMMIRLTKGLFDKSHMKRPDICEAMKSMNFVLAPSTPGIRSAYVTGTLRVSPSYVKNAIIR